MKTTVKKALAAFLAAALAAGLAGCAGGKSAGALKQLVIAEPVHLIGYLPLYMAQREGYFKEQGLSVKIIEATGGAHVTAVVSGSAWGVIGGVDSDALADKNNSDPVMGFCNVVNRANVYLVAKTGLAPKSGDAADLKAFLKGRTIVAGRHGGSPNLLTRYLLLKLGLDPEKDVKLVENADASTVVAMLQNGSGTVGNGAEPQISDGVSKGVWSEPFYKFPDLGDYSYSVMGTKKSTMKNDPRTVQKVTNAMVKALKAVQNRALAEKDLKLEFPTLTDAARKASLDRAYADKLWSPDGVISQKAVENDMDVLVATGIYTGSYTYGGLVNMQFVNKTAGK